MKPLFKYTGGKYKEYDEFKDKLPTVINNYYEPFVGAGGVLFRLNEENRVQGINYINDNSKTLTDFYKCVGDYNFKVELGYLFDEWLFIRDFSKSIAYNYGDDFFDYIRAKEDKPFVSGKLLERINQFSEVFPSEFNFSLHGFDIREKIIHQLNDKAKRFVKKDIGENETDVPFKCLTTAICQAFYFIIRDMYNDWNACGHKNYYSIYERCAHWIFIREYCFGSMFRFGPDGKFNVPYGGYAYNDKSIGTKLDRIFSDEANFIHEKTVITSYDFESAIKSYDFQENDFMFLDPPYDSTFSDYDGNKFTKQDHERLANTLKSTNCNWMMAIGKTDFIESLYKDFHVSEYGKTYAYQARGTYDNKNTTHLLITNY